MKKKHVHTIIIFLLFCVCGLVRCGSQPRPSPPAEAAASKAAQYKSCVQVGSAQAEKTSYSSSSCDFFVLQQAFCIQSWPQLEEKTGKHNTRVVFATFPSVCQFKGCTQCREMDGSCFHCLRQKRITLF